MKCFDCFKVLTNFYYEVNQKPYCVTCMLRDYQEIKHFRKHNIPKRVKK